MLYNINNLLLISGESSRRYPSALTIPPVINALGIMCAMDSLYLMIICVYEEKFKNFILYITKENIEMLTKNYSYLMFLNFIFRYHSIFKPYGSQWLLVHFALFRNVLFSNSYKLNDIDVS